MIFEEYCLKFTMFSMYAPSLVSNPRDEMSRFVTSVADLVKEEFHMVVLHIDMNLSRILLYAQSIKT